MGRNAAINNISDTHANTIYVRFCAVQKGDTPTDIKTKARAYLRKKKLSPAEAIAQPLPQYHKGRR